MPKLRSTACPLAVRRLWPALSITLAVLAIPALAMQFTNEVDWGAGDFLAAGSLLMALGWAIGQVRQRVRPAWQAGAILLVVACAALLWANAAVGLCS